MRWGPIWPKLHDCIQAAARREILEPRIDPVRRNPPPNPRRKTNRQLFARLETNTTLGTACARTRHFQKLRDTPAVAYPGGSQRLPPHRALMMQPIVNPKTSARPQDKRREPDLRKLLACRGCSIDEPLYWMIAPRTAAQAQWYRASLSVLRQHWPACARR